MIRATPAGVEIDVRVVPRAKKTEHAGTRDGAVLIRLAAPPVEGAANEALVSFFADHFKLPRRAVRLIAGERSRGKRILVEGLTADEVSARLFRP